VKVEAVIKKRRKVHEIPQSSVSGCAPVQMHRRSC